MTKKIILSAVFAIVMSACVATVQAEPNTTTAAKAVKKNQLPPTAKKAPKTTVTAAAALPEHKEFVISAGSDVGLVSGLIESHVVIKTLILAVED